MKLLETTRLKDLTIKNKMVMAAMTRSRADMNGVIRWLKAALTPH